MMTAEETKVLEYLSKHPSALVAEVAKSCLSGEMTAGWVDRVLANLDWLGYVVIHHGPDGEPAVLQITKKGLEQVVGHRRP